MRFQTPPVIKNLLIINALFFLAQTLLPANVGQFFDQYLALHYVGSPSFRVYQFVTYMFLHANVGHIFFNMFSLWMFGRIAEWDLGSKRFLTFYMVTGIGAALIHTLVQWAQIAHAESLIDPETLSQMKSMLADGMRFETLTGPVRIWYEVMLTSTVGASGAIYGVLLAFGMMHPNDRIMLLIPPIPMKAKYFVLIFIGLELYLGLNRPGTNIAHFAHLGGMLWGYILLRYWKRKGEISY